MKVNQIFTNNTFLGNLIGEMILAPRIVVFGLAYFFGAD